MTFIKRIDLAIVMFGLCLSQASYSLEESITFHVISPPAELDFTDVSSFFISLAQRSNKKSPDFPWGHSILEVHCTDSQSARHNLWTQYTTGQNLDEAFNVYKKSVMDDGEGLAFIYKPVRGLVETENTTETPSIHEARVGADVSRFLSSRNTLGSRWRYTKFKINSAICDSMIQRISEFAQNPSNDKYILGGQAREGRGANCTSYAVGFIDTLGLLAKTTTEKWTRQIIVPQRMVGTKDSPARIELNFFTSTSNSSTRKFEQIINWNKENEPTYSLYATDPWLYSEWVNEKITSIKQGTTNSSVAIDSANGIVVDDSNLQPRSSKYFTRH